MGWILFLIMLLVAQPLAAARNGRVPDPTSVTRSTGGVSVMGASTYAGTPGTWYLGATPPNVDYSKPVLLFVHGKGGSAQDWWSSTVYHGTNDMYAYAYQNGYRTAFVDLYPDKSMWDNGYLLNSLIDRIRSYFGVSKLAIVSHSKGGVDSNAASVHYGSAPKVSRVVTLGTPHWGTPLADMAYSSWTWWLAALMGQLNDATYVMQTGYMNYFRSITDGRDPSVPYYTISGYKCGPLFSALWYGCVAISGEDDGVVPVWSARKPGGIHLVEGYWDHDEIRMGSRTWSYFAPVIQTAGINTGDVAWAGPLLAAAGSQTTDARRGGTRGATAAAPGNLILRGGEAPIGHTFPVESGARGVTFTFYASSPGFTATLSGPGGAAYTVQASDRVSADHVFAGAWAGSVTVTAPAAGVWSLSTAAGSGRTGYLMIANLDTDLTATLETGADVATPGARLVITVGFASGSVTPAASRAEGAVSFSGEMPHARPVFMAAGGIHRATVDLPAANGIHSVTVTLTGTLADGSAFERTLVRSFAAVAPADRGTWKGRQVN